MIKKTLVSLFMSTVMIITIFGVVSHALVSEEWTRSFYTRDMVIDSSGNVYVAGTSSTIKYDPEGNPLWTSNYGASSGYSVADIMSVTNDNELYLTRGDATGNIYVTMLDSTTGDLKWESEYGFSCNCISDPRALVSDDSSNVYIAGYFYNYDTTSYSYVILKYNSNGSLIWVAEPSFFPRALAVSKTTGDVYVTGNEGTAKYGPAGNLIWFDSFAGYGGVDIEIGSSGNIYAVRNEGAHVVTSVYSAIGNMLWEESYTAVANYGQQAYNLSVDGSGNVYVTGDVWRTMYGGDCLTLKYDVNGSLMWVREYNKLGSEACYDIAVDSHNNVYAAGYTWNPNPNIQYRSLTIKYDSDGVLVWDIYDDNTSGTESHAYNVAVDNSLNVYAAGSSVKKYIQDPVKIITGYVDQYSASGDIADPSILYRYLADAQGLIDEGRNDQAIEIFDEFKQKVDKGRKKEKITQEAAITLLDSADAAINDLKEK